MRDKILKQLAHWHAAHPWRLLGVVVVLTIMFGFFAGQLQLTLRWSDLLPAEDPRTIQFNKILEEFTSATSLVVVVQGEEQQIKAFADRLKPRILQATIPTKDESAPQNNEKLFTRVDYKADLDFLRNHGLMLIKEADLSNMKDA
ncbi:MAG TPA: multidrug RND transporter, partial [bacterium]|nr:multidrug RND transporter [bacterium]